MLVNGAAKPLGTSRIKSCMLKGKYHLAYFMIGLFFYDYVYKRNCELKVLYIHMK